VNVDPEHPALPLSHPAYYSVYLAKLLGPFATLGLAEDTWARNEGVLDDAAYLDQVYAIHDERERMFHAALRRTRTGLCACVFDAPDRIQHMFTRAPSASDSPAGTSAEQVIDTMYARMDRLVGQTMETLGSGDVLFVLSDHGFTHFRRGVNLNVWLRDRGYLKTLAGREASDYLGAIDWSATRAYTFGLSGIYLNVKGRERLGVVPPADVPALKAEIAAGLQNLRDGDNNRRAVRQVYDARQVYHGPYAGNGPDLIVGYEDGYRASWDAASGKVGGDLFADNPKAWRGDHCVDSALVPGVLFTNWQAAPARDVRLMDMTPSILRLFGVPVPSYVDGEAVSFHAPTAPPGRGVE
jgi:predicted AlkP superfamily phosphohydrolase/phosphomutase